MSFTRGPHIVTDGLVIALDALSPRSYPGTGTTWYDISGNGYNASRNSNPNWNQNGWWEFRNVNNDNDYEYFSISNFDEGVLKSDNTSGQWTLETWFRDQGSAQGNENIIIGRSGHHSGILQQSSGTSVRGQVRTSSGSTGQIASSTSSTTNGVWKHIAFAYSGRASKFYTDGSLISSNTLSTSVTIYDHNDTFYIGGYPHNLYRVYGDIAVVRVYKKALTQEEVSRNYNAQKSRFGL